MIAILRCVDNRIIVEPNGGAKYFIEPEVFSRPMPATEEQQRQPFFGIDRSIAYQRKFERVKIMRDARTPDQDGHPDGAPLAFLYVEDEQPAAMPPEILSRRVQEIEAEWVRLGGLLDRLRAAEDPTSAVAAATKENAKEWFVRKALPEALKHIRARVTTLSLAAGLPPPVWGELCRLDSDLALLTDEATAEARR